jgi:hypothetical protein
MREIWRLMIAFLQGADVRRLIYRPSPYIYHSRPCQDDLYWLGACGGRVVGRSPLSVVPISAALRYQERRRRGVASARRAGVEVGESSAWDEYWMLLIDVLAQRHGASPVHSSEEIGYLQRRFPGNIRLFEARAGETKVAGVVVYDSGIVARAQYIAANEDGRKLHALDLLFDHLIREVFKERRYLDLGSSDGVAGSRLNDSLVEFKEGFGGRTVVLDTYELELRDAVIRTE